MDGHREWLNRRKDELKQIRYPYESDWKDILEYIMPYGQKWYNSDHNKTSNKRPRKIIDPTATLALEAAGAGMMSGITNPGRTWFMFRIPDPVLNESKPVRVWLDDVRNRMSEIFIKSNLYTTLPQIYLDLLSVGTSAFILLEDDEKVIRCFPLVTGAYWIGQDIRGVVNTCFREYQASADQLVKEFGIDNVSEQIKRDYENKKFGTMYDVTHAIVPNWEYDDGKLQSKYKRFRSCYYLDIDKDNYLKEEGFDSFPVMAPRWQVVAEDVYGFGQGIKIIGAVRMLQNQQSDKLAAEKKSISPPMVLNGRLRDGAASIMSGDITAIDVTQQGGTGFQPAYQVNPSAVQILDASIEQTQQFIKRGLFEDMFLLISQDDRSNITAYEISQRIQEKMMRLGPVLERLNDELLDPLITRTFEIMLKRGLIPEPPEEPQGQELVIEYTSIMAQVQKMQAASTIQDSLAFVGSAMAMDPSARHKVDFVQAVDEYFNAIGTPPKMVRSDAEVAELVMQEQRAAQMQQMAAMAQSAAQTTKTLADAQTSEPSALQMLAEAASQSALGA